MHCNQSSFGGAVVGEVRGWDFAQHACDCDDCAAVGRGKHAGQKRAEGVEVGDEVDVEIAGDFRRGKGPERFAIEEAGVVD